MDKQFKRIVERLETEGLADSTLIVITGDHGVPHSCPDTSAGSLFDEAVRVPIIFYNPRLEPRRVEEPCALIDVAPTILHLIGRSAPPGLKGRVLTTAPGEDHHVILESLGAGPGDFEFKAIKIAVVRGGHKLIWREGGYTDTCPPGENYLFDLDADPTESVNLYTDKRYSTIVAELEAVAVRRCDELRQHNRGTRATNEQRRGGIPAV